MKQHFSSHMARLPKRGYRVALVAALFAVALIFGAFSFAPAAHAASVTPAARPNTCQSGWPCVKIWATQVNVRNWTPDHCLSYPSTSCPVIGTLAGGGEHVIASCQQPGQTITYDGYTSRWWMFLKADNGRWGFSSNVFIVGGAHISGVPDCGF